MKLLVADDDPLQRAILSRLLAGWGYQVQLAKDGIEAWEVLEQPEPPQLVILDWMMPGMDGPDLCRKLRGLQRPYTYVLLLTARNEREDILEGLESGADDYLTKPVEIAELQAKLRVGRRIIDLETKLLNAYESMRFEARHDALTSVMNRVAVFERLRAELSRTRRGGSSTAVLLADIDHFKKINDTYGHQQGDFVLVEVVRRMSSCIRAYDSIGRYGGEEFLIIASDCTAEAAVEVAERLRAAGITAFLPSGRSVPAAEERGPGAAVPFCCAGRFLRRG
jgi:PleD family two-component response regulator